MANKGNFSWVSDYTTLGVDEPALYIKNDSSDILGITSITVGSRLDNIFTVACVSGTAEGTVDDGINRDVGGSDPKTDGKAISFGGAPVTGISQAEKLYIIRTQLNLSNQHKFNGADTIFVEPGEAIAVYVKTVSDISICVSASFV